MRKFTQLVSTVLLTLMLVPVTANALNMIDLEAEVVSFIHSGRSTNTLVSLESLAPNNVGVETQAFADGGYNFYLTAFTPGEELVVRDVSTNGDKNDTTIYNITVTRGKPLLIYRGEEEINLEFGSMTQYGLPTVHIRDWASLTDDQIEALEMDETAQAAWMERGFGLPWAAEFANGDYKMTIIDSQLEMVADDWVVTSSDERVVSVDKLGVIEAVGAGDAVVTLKWVGNDRWEADSVSIAVHVDKPVAAFWFEAEAYYAALACEQFESPKPQSEIEGLEFVYTSNDTTIAMVDAKTGEVTPVAEGECEIQATFFGNDEYEGNEAVYILYVTKAVVTEPSLSFPFPSESAEFDVYWGEKFEAPEIVNQYELPLTWASSNPRVATIDEEGNITLVGFGQTTISADFEGDQCFTQAHAQYTLIVNEPMLALRIMGKEVTKENMEDILGDGSVSYNLYENELTVNNLFVDFANQPDTAQTFLEDGNEMSILTIVISGKCVLMNAQTGFSHPRGIRFVGTAVDTLICNGLGNQFYSDRLYIEGLYAEFDATEIAVVADELSITNNGHLLAKAIGEKGYAINLAELEMDDNIQILTKGVEFAQIEHEGWSEAGFFTDADHTMQAMEVEIGKAPVVIADDEVTTIDFTQTTPDGEEKVVISLGVEDTYNPETKQLEISTALTDEQVADALENLVPGSSAFMDALPGSITLDIPAGQGAIDIQCITLPGYTLNVKIEGQVAIKLTQTTFGWAHVDYDVETAVHVVLYLHADASNLAPARIKADNPSSAALCIQAIKITPANAPQGLEQTTDDKLQITNKMIIDNQLYLFRDGQFFNAQGIRVK